MKRGGPLRRTPFKPKPQLGRSKPHTAGSKKNIPPWVVEAVQRRSGGRCEVRVAVRCSGHGEQRHHRLMRSAGGKHTQDNLLDVCGHCHAYIHANPRESYERGWLLRRD